jgi:putative SOS response-associated peptidase YedK
MCGRFTITATKKEIRERFEVKFPGEWKPNYNAAPTQILPIITNEHSDKITLAKWGLIPHWAKDEKIGYKLINARSETIFERPSFRTAAKKRRCLVIADGFYEWKKGKDGKTPFRITTKKEELFAMAGIWETWNGVITFTIATTKPNAAMKKIHDRMPVILSRTEERKWLEGGDADLLDSYGGQMKVSEVSSDVNNARNNYKELLE